MGIRIEWMHAEGVTLALLRAGEDAADHQQVSSPLGLEILGDDGIVIEGTQRELLTLIDYMGELVSKGTLTGEERRWTLT